MFVLCASGLMRVWQPVSGLWQCSFYVAIKLSHTLSNSSKRIQLGAVDDFDEFLVKFVKVKSAKRIWRFWRFFAISWTYLVSKLPGAKHRRSPRFFLTGTLQWDNWLQKGVTFEETKNINGKTSIAMSSRREMMYAWSRSFFLFYHAKHAKC